MDKTLVIALVVGGVVLILILVALLLWKVFIKTKTPRSCSHDVECDNLETFTPNSNPTPKPGISSLPEGRPIRDQVTNNRDNSKKSNAPTTSRLVQDNTQISASDYPSQTLRSTTVESSCENIYENVEIRMPNTCIPQISDDASTIASPQTRSYKDVVLSITIQPTTRSHANANANAELTKDSFPRVLSPPTSAKSHTRSKTQNRYRAPKASRFLFPFKTLVLATDATPRNIGGYFINHFSKTVEFYAVPSSSMPWILRNRTRSGNPTEFEMKNLLCALLLWEHKIARHKRIAIFTDNSAIIGNSLYGSRVRSFIHHLEYCRQVLHVNPLWTFVNSKEQPNIFDEFIVPADKLSRLDEPGFKVQIMAYHNQLHEGEISQLNFNVIKRKIMYWTRNQCQNCGFKISRDGSLKKGMT